MRYALLRLEEEIRIVLDVRRSLPNDADLTNDIRSALLLETSKQLRDLVQAVRILERSDRVNTGESTLSGAVRAELVSIIGFTTNSESTPT